MSQRMAGARGRKKKRSRLGVTLLWVAVAAIVIIVLLVKEKADWLYVLATLGVTVLLMMVAMADLKHAQRSHLDTGTLNDDAAAIGNGLPPGVAASSSSSSPAVKRTVGSRPKRRRV